MDISHKERPRILVVDDDTAVQVSLALLLKQSGYDAVCCDGPAQALALLARQAPDLARQSPPSRQAAPTA